MVVTRQNGVATPGGLPPQTVSFCRAGTVVVGASSGISVAENSANGTSVGTVAAGDPDAGEFIRIAFAMPLHWAVHRKPFAADFFGEDDHIAVIELRVRESTGTQPIFAC